MKWENNDLELCVGICVLTEQKKSHDQKKKKKLVLGFRVVSIQELNEEVEFQKSNI